MMKSSSPFDAAGWPGSFSSLQPNAPG